MAAPNRQPMFPERPNIMRAKISVANTNRDGTTGTYVQLGTIGVIGGRVDKILAIATGTTTAGMIRLFLADSGGANKWLWGEIPVSAAVPSGTVQAWTGFFLPDPQLPLNASMQIWASTHNAEEFVIIAVAGDL